MLHDTAALGRLRICIKWRVGAGAMLPDGEPALKLTETTEPRTRKAARHLRALSLSVPEGSFLGSEKDLIARLGVSRPTFRQAARLVEHEQLLAISRGVGGGFHARRPDVSTVINAAVTYMLTDELQLADLFCASTTLTIEAVRLAAAKADAAGRARVEALIARLAPLEHVPQDWPDFHREETEILELLCELGGNRALGLFLSVLFQFASIAFPLGLFNGRDDLMQVRRSSRLKVLRAVLERDPQVATMLMYRDAEYITAHATPAIQAQVGEIGRLIARQAQQ
ncbi:MAG: FadR family transcriptional regulator [Sphingomonadales bacterium]|nr:FadR family transcriptional regulator [Sphingomonadales bacterium]